MKAAIVDFKLESMSLYVREFYASKMGTLEYFSKEAVANAISYQDMFKRDKKQEWQEMHFPFNNTPAIPIDFAKETIVYKAGDDTKKGLLRYGKQDVLIPNSKFRFIVWGDYPMLEKGQIFFIGKKRGIAKIIDLQEFDVEPTRDAFASLHPFPIQLKPSDLKKLSRYFIHVATSRFFIVSVPPSGEFDYLVLANYVVPLI
jgi:hypothetical protein